MKKIKQGRAGENVTWHRSEGVKCSFWKKFSINYFLAAVSLHCSSQAFSSCSEQGLLSRYGAWASHHGGSSGCRPQALGYESFHSCSTWAQQLWQAGSVALQHVGSSWTRDQTHVPCIDRWILNHWTTKNVPEMLFWIESSRKGLLRTQAKMKWRREPCR